MIKSTLKKWIRNSIVREYKKEHNQKNPLWNLELHAYLSNYKLREREDVEIGQYTYGCPTVWGGGGYARLIIGNFCCLGPNISIHLVSDHHPERITTYDLRVLLRDGDIKYSRDELVIKGDVIIGNDVWIGENVIILPGVKIGDGCIIGAGSIVTKNLEPYSIAVGNPCLKKKDRFTKEEKELLLEMKWWNWTDEQIFEAISLLETSNLERLYVFYKENVIK